MTAASVITICCINFAASFLQASVGFGYGILAMSLMPLFIPMRTSSAVSAVVIVTIGFQMVFTLRKHIEWKMIILPVLACLSTIPFGIRLLMIFPENILRIILGIFIICLAVYFSYTSKRQITIKNTWQNSVIVGLFTGISTGLFNIVGPLFMVYYYGTSKDHISYKANLEFTFLTAGIISSILHLYNGNINTMVLPYLATSSAAALLAGVLGLHFFRKLDRTKMRRIITLFLPIMALFLILQ